MDTGSGKRKVAIEVRFHIVYSRHFGGQVFKGQVCTQARELCCRVSLKISCDSPTYPSVVQNRPESDWGINI